MTSAQMPGTRTELVQTRNLRFEVAIAEPAAGDTGKLALLLHGFPEHHYSWRYQIEPLTALGYRVWAPNLRGYGQSDRPLGVEAYTIDKLEQDVADLIERAGAKSVLLVGHDWGAAIAWMFAMHGSAQIERLIIMNVPHPARFERGIRSRAQLLKSWYMFFFQIPKLPELLISLGHSRAIGKAFSDTAVHKERFPEQVTRVFQENAAIPGAMTAMLNYYRAIPLDMQLTKRRGYPKIHTPTLMIWGEQDPSLGKELSFGTDKHVSDLTVRYLPEASHWVQQDAPETVNAMITAWLTGKPVPEVD